MTTHVKRHWTGQASCLSWHYDFRADGGGGDSAMLHLRLFADDSTGGNPPHCVGDANGEIRIDIRGEWEAREFTAVLLDLVLKLTENGLAPWEIFPHRDVRQLSRD